jgi:predicted HicB family RNase H-like nuclease
MTKKKFTNPANQFISDMDNLDQIAEEAERDMQERQLAFDLPDQEKETRSRRVQSYFTPSLHSRGAKLAKSLGISFNDLLNQSLEETLEKHNS